MSVGYGEGYPPGRPKSFCIFCDEDNVFPEIWVHHFVSGVVAWSRIGGPMGPSGPSHAPGAVPDPGATAGTTKFLREDATWGVPIGSGSDPIFVASGSGHASGNVPDPGATQGVRKYLREDATWADPPGADYGEFVLPANFTLTTPTNVYGYIGLALIIPAPAFGTALYRVTATIRGLLTDITNCHITAKLRFTPGIAAEADVPNSEVLVVSGGIVSNVPLTQETTATIIAIVAVPSGTDSVVKVQAKRVFTLGVTTAINSDAEGRTKLSYERIA